LSDFAEKDSGYQEAR